METFGQQMNPETIAEHSPQLRTETMSQSLGDPVPFDVWGHFEKENGVDNVAKTFQDHSNFEKAIDYVARPFKAQGYTAGAALWRGTADFYNFLDNAAGFIEDLTGMERGGVFKKLAQVANEQAPWWEQRAKEVGVGVIDEIVGEAVGGAVPYITKFLLQYRGQQLLTGMAAVNEAEERGSEHPYLKALTEMAKVRLMGKVFQMMEPLQYYFKAPAMGTLFGTDAAVQAPEGEKVKAFAKGMGTGMIYGAFSPGGHYGFNEVNQQLKPIKEAFIKRIKDESGAIDLTKKPDAKPLSFLKTIKESMEIDPELKQLLKEGVETDYIVKPNVESVVEAQKFIAEKGIEEATTFVMGESPLSAVKGATFRELIKDANNRGEYLRAGELVEQFAIQLKEAGQGIQTASLFMNTLTPQGFIMLAERKMRDVQHKYGFLDESLGRKPDSFKLTLEEKQFVFESYAKMKQATTPLERAEIQKDLWTMVGKKVPPSAWEWLDSMRKSGMLGNFRTQLRNIMGNAVQLGAIKPIDLVMRVPIDYARTYFNKQSERNFYLSDVPQHFKVMANAHPMATQAFMDTLLGREGTMIEKPEVGMEIKDAFSRARMEQLPLPLKIVPRFMEATDIYFKVLATSAEVARLKETGMTDAQIYKEASRLADIDLFRNKLDPSDPNLSYAARLVTSLGKMVETAKDAQRFGDAARLVDIAVPFHRTPTNIAAQMIEHSPLGFFRKGITSLFKKEMEPGLVENTAKAMTGSVLMSVAAVMVGQGLITWMAPTNKREKAEFYATGRKPFSVLIGDQWVPLWYLGPLGLAMALPAAYDHYTNDSKVAITGDMTDKMAAIATGVAKYIGSQTSLPSFYTLIGMLSGNLDYNAANTAGFMATQFIPASSFIRWVNTMIDPVIRKPRGFWESVEAQIPGLSQKLEAHLTPELEPVRRDWKDWFLPYATGTYDPNREAAYKQAKYRARVQYLDTAHDKIIKSLRDKKITVQEAQEQVDRLNRAYKERFRE